MLCDMPGTGFAGGPALESPCDMGAARDVSLIPGSGRPPGEGTRVSTLPGGAFHGQWSLASCGPTTFVMLVDIQKALFSACTKKTPHMI